MRKFISFMFLILTLSKTRKKWRQTTEWMVQTAHWAALCLVFVCRLEALTCPVWGPAWWWPRSGRAFPSPIPSPNSSRTSGSPPELSAPPLAQGSTWPSVYRWGFPGLFFIIFFFKSLTPHSRFLFRAPHLHKFLQLNICPARNSWHKIEAASLIFFSCQIVSQMLKTSATWIWAVYSHINGGWESLGCLSFPQISFP